jgi:hypothetical protein
MPTINPRVNVTLSPSLYGMVGELAKYQRVSRSMVLRELLEASEPALAQVVAMMRAAEDMTEAARTRLLADMDSALVSLEDKKDQALALAAGATADLVAQAESIRGRRPGRRAGGMRQRPTGSAARPALSDSPAAPSGPPSSNRGVKSRSSTTKKIAPEPAAQKPKPKKSGSKNRGVNAS